MSPKVYLSVLLLSLLSTTVEAITEQPLSTVENPLIWGVQANLESTDCEMSGDGLTVAFESRATQLIANDRNGLNDVFVRSASGLQRVSQSISGADATKSSFGGALSTTGRYTAFISSDDLLINGFGTPSPAYWLDRQTNTLLLASKNLSGTAVDTSDVAISGNGRYVFYVSSEGNIAAGDTNAENDVFRFDTTTGTTELVSKTAAGIVGNDFSYEPSADETGNLVAFASRATNFVVGISGQIFVRNMSTGALVRASQTTAGVGGDASSYSPNLSANGNFVVFETNASNLDSATPDTNGVPDIYRHNLTSGTTLRVSVSAASGNNANGASFVPAVSANGRYVWFTSEATDLVTQNFPLGLALFRRDMTSTDAIRVARTTNNSVPTIDASDDGQRACFSSANALEASDTNLSADVYLSDIVADTKVRQSIAESAHPSIFGATNVYLRDTSTGANKVLVGSAGIDLDAEFFSTAQTFGSRLFEVAPIAGSKRVLSEAEFFSGSCAANCALLSVSTFLGGTIYQLNPAAPSASALTLVSRALDGSAAWATGESSISDAGTRIAFASDTSNIVVGDTNGTFDIFLWDATFGAPTIRRVNVSTSGAQANDFSNIVRLSGTGDFAVFVSQATNLVANDTNSVDDIFLRDITNNITTRVSGTVAGAELAQQSHSPTISSDGRYSAYMFGSTNRIHLFDRITLARVALTIPAGVTPVSDSLAFGRDSRYLGFIGNDSVDDIAYRYDLLSNTPIRELLRARNIDSASGDRVIETLRLASASKAVLDTNKPLNSDDGNAAFDVVMLTLETGSVAFTNANITVSESVGTINLPVNRSGGIEARVEARGVFVTGSAQATDYSVIDQDVFWEDSVTGTRNLRLNIVDDGSPEGTETLSVILTATGGASVGAISTLTINIQDNDIDDLFKNGFE